MNDIKQVLKDAGFAVVEGADDVKAMIKKLGNNDDEHRCSGYGVFPNGDVCSGCGDCKEKNNE